jgi:predicted CXXCH cytochrome family protein
MTWLTHLRRSHPVRRVVTTVALTAALLLYPLPASGGVWWDIGMAVGYAALVCAATLYLYPLRSGGLPHRRLFTLSQHRRIGWIAVSLGALHAVILLGAQPLVWQYLLPTAPVYMLLGLVALVALAVLVATGLSARTALRKTTARSAPPASVSSHAVLAALLLALIGAHLVGSAQLLDNSAKALTACLLLAIPLVWAAYRALRHRVREAATPRTPTPRPPSRPSARLLTTVLPSCAAVIALLLLPLPTASSRLLLKQPTPPRLLPVSFPHEKHTSVNCVVCHHNFVDKTGIGSCLDCHRSNRADLTESAEATFHTFCRGCHTQLAEAPSTKHGPTRSCAACHITSAPGSLQAGADSGASTSATTR